MVNRFTLKPLFTPEQIQQLIQTFGFRRQTADNIEAALQAAFSDYVLLALTESSDDEETRKQIYLESQFHIEKAQKRLSGMPHPAGKMASRLASMIQTLQKLIEGDDMAADRATRFMEKNLIRRLRDLWQNNTSTPFHTGGDGSGRNPRDFLLMCFAAAHKAYPEISWFHSIDLAQADRMIQAIKR